MRRRCVLTVCLTWAASLLVASRPASAVTLTDLVGEVSQSQYQSYQLTLQDMGLGLYGGSAYNQGYRNRYNAGGPATESLGFKEANLYLANTFGAMGLNVTVQSNYKNVVAELPGVTNPSRIYIISGHYDHPQSNFEAPGGDDNASGTAGVIEAARILSQYRFNATLRFIAWGGEEGWMLGSWDYVRNVVVAHNENIAGVLNLDMILRPAWDGHPEQPSDLDVSTGTSAQCVAWGNAFLGACQSFSPSLLLDSRNLQHADWYPSDQGPFIDPDGDQNLNTGTGYPALMVAENTAQEIWGGSHAYYHTANDASDRLAGPLYDYAFATDVVRASVGLLAQEAQLAGADVPEPASLSLLALGALLVRRRVARRTAA